MKQHKYGFTLAELLICLTCVGILSVVALSIIRPFEVRQKYMLAPLFYSLDKAVYNGMQNPDFNPFAVTDASGNAIQHEAANDGGTLRLCKALSFYINPNENIGADGTASTCSSAHIAPSSGDLTGVTPQFTGRNNYRFFISGRQGSDSTPNDTYFYIVYVDTNGERGPNTVQYTAPNAGRGEIVPDIYAFAVLPIGRVVPLGIMETDDRFLEASFTYEMQNPNPNDTNTITRYSRPRAYYVAKSNAWGYYSGIPNPSFVPDEPFTYNDYIRSNLPEGNLIYHDAAIPAIGDGEGLQNDAPFLCTQGETENCGVSISNFVY